MLGYVIIGAIIWNVAYLIGNFLGLSETIKQIIIFFKKFSIKK